MGVGEHECVVIENQRWSIRHRAYLCDALLPKVDPPAFCTESGAATSIDELNDRTERSLLNRRPGSAIKSWRWKEGSQWRASDWHYAIAFQSTFKILQDRTCMVRRRMWFRTRVAIARDLTGGAGAAVDSDTAGAAAAQPHEGERGGRGGPAVRFAEGTVYSRELDNRRWRASASSRAAPQWTKQYFADCVTCDICPVRAVAAFLAVGGVSVYERQSQARLVLAGKAPWPEESAMTAVLEMADALTPVALELQDTLVHDITELGQAEAIPIAEQHFVFAAVNAKARVANEGQNGEGGETAAAAAPAPTAAASPVPDDKLQGFVTQTLTRLELEAQPNEDALGYDTSDGWFVLDEQLDLVSPDPGASSGGAGARRSPRDDGLDVDDSM
eukprot:m.122841 g.122841  ORF g.122841 m.122841 type:complete len:387 (-) comp13437_c0_seq5:162-1322(-)